MQKITVIGHLGKDAQVKTFSEDTVINFSVAHNSEYVDKETGEYIKKTQWFSCAFWRDSEVYKVLKAGTQVYVEGEVSAGTYVDKNGKVQVDLQVKVQKLVLLGSPENKPKDTANTTQKADNQVDSETDDIF